MIYLQGTQVEGHQIVEVDRTGRETVVLAQFANYRTPRWSPTGDRIAMVKVVPDGGQVWIYDRRSQTLSQLTTEGSNYRPSWSPDGSRVAFHSGRGNTSNLVWMPADRSGPAERVVDGEEYGGISATFWTHDGAWIVVDGPAAAEDGQEDIFVVGTGADRKRKALIATAADEQTGVVSPDGKWIAYASNESGMYQVYVRPFMRDGGRWLVSTGGAINALWASNTELTYRDTDSRSLVSAKLELGQTVSVIERTPLFSDQPYLQSGVSVAEHDISRDGQRFLMLRRSNVTGERPMPVVVLNWTAEVTRRMMEQGGRAP
jgi:Tol biopolymer transport system component